MKRTHRSRQLKGGGFRGKVADVKTSLRRDLLYVMCGALVLVNGLFVYSLVAKFTTSKKNMSGEATVVAADDFLEGRTLRVQVLNGAGVEGIARTMTDFLRGKGFDVIDFGNAEVFHYYKTVVLNRSGDRTAAALVAQAVNTMNIVEQKNPFLTLDVTLIIGRDYRKLLPFKSERGQE